MVEVLGWGCLFLIIGFGAGRLCHDTFQVPPETRTRRNKKLSTEQLSTLLLGIYVGLAVATIQKAVDGFETLDGPKVSVLVLAALTFLIALIIQYLFLNRTNTEDYLSLSTADEIEKLASLLSRGLLSQNEFDSEKSRLINKQ